MVAPQGIAAPSAARLAVKIGRRDRVLFLGTTGAGKSFLAGHMVANAPVITVIDPKWEFDLPGAKYVKHYDPRIARQVFRPPMVRPIHEETEEFLDDFWRHRKAGIIYADEVNDLQKGPRAASPAWNRIIRQGRSWSVCAWSASQRPSDVASVVYTESQHFFVFALGWEEDRKKVQSFTGDGVAAAVDRLGEYQCVYYDKRRRLWDVLPPTITHVGSTVVEQPRQAQGGWFSRIFK